ncbi:cell adhesion molecule Dscam1-like isoform X2 [Artemia franciscana]|uniref:cell adhesion molecule Dscam1-like isoform X2 n=1 Tax=Artemia franciscana TaxID=6661 RepID=UPI0032DBCFF3
MTIYLLILGFPSLVNGLRGPLFHVEPPSRWIFSNSTESHLHCSAIGYPLPEVSWIDCKGKQISSIDNLRIIRNGTITFKPFSPRDFRPDVHATTLRCEASNTFGKIWSRPIKIAGIIDEDHRATVEDARVYLGNDGILQCNMHQKLSELVVVSSWLIDNSINVYPSPDFDGKYVMLPSGELIVSDVSLEDTKSIFQCRTLDKLTRKTKLSNNIGKILVIDSPSSALPKITKQVQPIRVNRNEVIVLHCVTAGYPSPKISWFFKSNLGSWTPYQDTGNRGGSVKRSILRLWSADSMVNPKYACRASNSVGSDWAEFQVCSN